jgi:hypothetical protein
MHHGNRMAGSYRLKRRGKRERGESKKEDMKIAW